MRLQNLVYLIIVAGHLILKVTHAGLQDILKLLALFVVAGILCLLVRLVMAAFLGQRLVIHNPHVRPDLLGRPLLFPAKLSHARRFPASERYNYWYDYFMVGVPVGFRGRIGNLISIDNQPTSESILEKCWFTIDPAYYLEPGSGDRTLEEKLNIFLHNLGENPQKFPYTYMISVPRFLWWQKSAISYWYLYSPSRELTAMIMEINNSFYEKRNIFFRLTGDGMPVDEPPSPSSTIIASAKGTRESVSLRSHSPASKRKYYKGYWDKVIFGSPFEKVEGYMLAKTVDILRGPSLQSTLSSNNPDGQVKITSRLASWGNPVDPLTASGWDIARFISRWTHVGALSAPRIVKEALRIRFRGNLKYLQRPEVHPGTNPRKETNVERPVLEIEILTPRFYTSFTDYPDAKTAFARETAVRPTNSDPDSRYLNVSDPSLLDKVLDTSELSIEASLSTTSNSISKYHTDQDGIATALLRFIISKLRSSSRKTVIDRFVFQDHGRFSPSQRWNYLVNVLHYHLSLCLPIESQAIVMLGFITARAMIVGGLLDAFYTLWAQWVRDETGMTPATGALVFAGWDMINNYIGQYYTNPFAWGEGL
ncbi:putative proteasome subunit alpha type-3 domain protein [Aspergillus niger]|nr:putative proteasome subunit alpha type-3 domain protein [Aspergillus niger]